MEYIYLERNKVVFAVCDILKRQNMRKKKIIIGNWKMNPVTAKEAEKLLGSVVKNIPTLKNTEVVICPPFLYIDRLRKVSKKVSFGAQDAFWGEVGAFTGEVSTEMLYEAGARYVVVGHSERRALGETDPTINKKVKGALASSLTPVLCVGEVSRDAGHGHFDIVKMQIQECLKGIPKNAISKIIIAYEPVWAISSTPNRRDATSADSLEMAIFIRRVLSDLSSPAVAKETTVIYGGSVNDKDVGEFLEHGGVDGVLAGRASLDPKKFTEIVRICEALGK